MAKQNYGTCTGKCPICTINIWDASDDKPVIWPCNILGCPHEDPKKQNLRIGLEFRSITGSGLAQI